MYELYVVKIMQEQTLEKSDETIGIKTIVKSNGDYTRISVGKIGEHFDVNDEVYVLSPAEHSQYLQLKKDAENYLAKINQLEFEINDADIRTLKKDNEDLKRQIKNKNNSINTYKTNSVKSKATIENLQETIQQHKKTIDELKEHNDAIANQLDNSADASEIEDLQKENQQLKEQVNEYKSKYESIFSDYTKTTDECIAHLDEKNKLKETNQFLNEQVSALNTTFTKTKDALESKYQKEIKDLKETIKKQQSHIDELTDKYQSLLNKQDYIAPTSHYDEILALTNQLNDAKTEINRLNGEIETKLAIQKSELDSEHNKEKAQMLVAYNKDLDNVKLKYNHLANEYNNLLANVHTITKLNALFDSRHEKIIKDKEPFELMPIQSEQLPPADEDVLEFVPKE